MNQRFYSLDVFRGATVCLMILVNNPGSWAHIYPPLEHAPWHGCTPTDLVFPFFLFAVGNALAFVMPKLEAKGNTAVWQKIIRRSLLIFLIGLFLNWFPFIRYNDVGEIVAKPFTNLRFFGVLQRIALAYFFASVIVHFAKAKGSFFVAAVILLFYWVLCIAANPVDPFSIQGWFGTAIDKALLGETHMYHGEGIAFDPEGIMSSFAPIAEVLFGYLAGNYILQKGKTTEMLNGLFVAGCALVFTGYIWNWSFPINKKIWTSSFTVYTSGLALLTLALMVYAIEFKGIKTKADKFFTVFGKNALFIFAMSGIIPRTLGLIRINNGLDVHGKPKFLNPLGWFYEVICKPVLPYDARIGSLLYALCFITFMWLLAWILDRKKIYIRV
jgi:predicted acyltransferase